MDTASWSAIVLTLLGGLVWLIKRAMANRDQVEVKLDKLAEAESHETDDAMARVDAELERMRMVQPRSGNQQ